MTMHTKYGMGTLYRRGGTWWIQYFLDGKRIRESAKTTEEKQARLFLKRRLGEAATGAHAGMGPERARISDVLALLLDSYRNQERHSTATVAGQVKNHIGPILGKCLVSQFGSADVARYIRKRQSASPRPANASINRELSALRHALNLGLQHTPPMVARTIKITLLKEDNVRKGFIDYQQYLSLKLCLPEYLQPLLAAGFYLGCRIGELRSMKWPQVDLNAGIITIHANQAKSGKHREIPIYGELKEILAVEAKAAKAYPKCPWVFHRQGLPIGDIRKAWKTAGGMSGVRILFHDLRRSAARNMEIGGMSRERAKQITGHGTNSMFERYAGVSNTKDMVDAGKIMERFFEGEKQAARKEKIN